jgi:long-chain acyl-CoA synthetase
VTKKEDIMRLREQTRIAAEDRKVYFYGFENPQVLILVSNDKRNMDGCQDASCAVENIMLAATSYGLGSCWLNPLMTLRDVEPVCHVLDDFGIPSNHTVWAMVALGYPVAEGVLLAKKKDVVYWV